MKYDLTYPSLLCVARDVEGLVKTSGQRPCVTCGLPTGWATLERVRVCSDECRFATHQAVGPIPVEPI